MASRYGGSALSVAKLRLRSDELKALASGIVADPNWRQIRLFHVRFSGCSAKPQGKL
jgi:hypothetical protein